MTRRIVLSSHKNSEPRVPFWWSTGSKLRTTEIGTLSRGYGEDYSKLQVKMALEGSSRLTMTQPMSLRKTPLKIKLYNHPCILSTWEWHNGIVAQWQLSKILLTKWVNIEWNLHLFKTLKELEVPSKI